MDAKQSGSQEAAAEVRVALDTLHGHLVEALVWLERNAPGRAHEAVLKAIADRETAYNALYKL